MPSDGLLSHRSGMRRRRANRAQAFDRAVATLLRANLLAQQFHRLATGKHNQPDAARKLAAGAGNSVPPGRRPRHICFHYEPKLLLQAATGRELWVSGNASGDFTWWQQPVDLVSRRWHDLYTYAGTRVGDWQQLFRLSDGYDYV